MIRIASHFTFCSPEDIRRRAVIELDGQQTVTRLFSLDENTVESSRTLFFDGILSAEIISIKELGGSVGNLTANYNYVDFSNGIPAIINKVDKPLILDFGTSSPEKINKLLPELSVILAPYSTFEIIAACCYFPALALGVTPELGENRKTTVLLWENIDLINIKTTLQTRIRKIY